MARTWLDRFTKNWADLDEGETDSKLHPVALSIPRSEAVTRVADVLKRLARWQVNSADPAAGTIEAVHITVLWRFRDDVRIRFEPSATGATMFAHSQARLGAADFGKNAQNLRELTDAVRKGLA